MKIYVVWESEERETSSGDTYLYDMPVKFFANYESAEKFCMKNADCGYEITEEEMEE